MIRATLKKREMAAAGSGIAFFSLWLLPSLPPRSRKAKLPTLILKRRISSSNSWTASPTACSSSSQTDQQAEPDGADAPDDSAPSTDDANFLWKLAAGSLGGACVIKYGSVLYPQVTRPNIVEALLIVSVPVLVAVLILIKESSSSESKSKDIF